MNRFRVSLVCVAALLTLVSRSDAGMIVTMEDVGPNVVMTGSGSINTSGFSFLFNANSSSGFVPGLNFLIGAQASTAVFATPLTGPTSFGPSMTPVAASSGTGNIFVLGFAPGNANVGLPIGYVSGSPLSGSATFLGKQIANFSVVPGNYVWTLGNGDTITLQIGSAATVPEPASMLAWGLLSAAGLAVMRMSRRG